MGKRVFEANTGDLAVKSATCRRLRDDRTKARECLYFQNLSAFLWMLSRAMVAGGPYNKAMHLSGAVLFVKDLRVMRKFYGDNAASD
jgi:hypothetical protein